MPVRMRYLLILACTAATLAAQQPPRGKAGPPAKKLELEHPLFQWDGLRFDVDHLLDEHQMDLDLAFELPAFEFQDFDFDFDFDFDMPEWKASLDFDWPAVTVDVPGWQSMTGKKSAMHRMPDQDSPSDSAYRAARETLNRHEYRRASEMLASFVTRYPRSRHAAAAMYWRAFALYRVGTTAELEQALRVLDAQRQQYPDAASDPEVSGLSARVLGALAARGNVTARQRLRQQAATGVQSCDREDMEVRAEALGALVQSDPANAAPVLRRILARQDECSVPLRRRAVYLLGREGVGGTAQDLVAVAKNDPDRSVRSDALSRLAQFPGDVPVRLLDTLLTGSSDEATQRAVLVALRRSDHPEADRILRRAIERTDLSERVRAEAVRSLLRRSPQAVVVAGHGVSASSRKTEPTLSSEDVALLRSVYQKSDSRTVKSAVLETMSRGGGSAGDLWLTEIARNPNEELRYRTTALSRLRRSDVPIAELSRLYDALSERELRNELIRILGTRDEPEATDKLIEIARTGTDPSVRRNAINALTRKKDERTTKLLLELVEKQP